MTVRSLAIFADIHANLPALEAVLDDISRQNVDEVLVGGDLVGRGPEGSAVAKRIRELGFATIGGNHEDYLLDFRGRRVPDEWWTSREWAAARWMAEELDDDDEAYLASLPFSLEREDLILIHGTPDSNRDGIGPWTSDEQIKDFHTAGGRPILVCAHTHRPMLQETGDGLVVNVGSVGLPFNRDQRAQYAILRRGGRWGWEVEMRQVPYDVDRVRKIYQETGFREAGGATAELLLLELEHASPLLVPFIKWAEVTGVEATTEQLEDFFNFMPPGGRLRDFAMSIRALEAKDKVAGPPNAASD